MKLISAAQAAMLVYDFQHLKGQRLMNNAALENTVIDEVVAQEMESGWQVRLIGDYQDAKYVVDFFTYIKDFGIEFDFEKYGLAAPHE